MIIVGKKSTKGKVKVLAQFSDSEEDAAVELAKSLAQHNRGEMLVCLVTNKKYRILKKVKKSFVLAIPTLRHPFRLPGFHVRAR